MNKQKLLQARKEAYSLWGRTDGNIYWSRLARETGLTIDQLKYYKKKDQWQKRLGKARNNEELDKKATQGLRKMQYKPESRKELNDLQRILDESGLPEQRKLFIMYYFQSYNVKWSAIQAGYSKKSANVRGSVVMKDEGVQEVMNQIKGLMHKNLYIRVHDVIDEYVKIAFADITEFVEFEGNKVTLKNSTDVDGRLITEIRQGREGISLKMADKMKALERLEKMFEMIPDKRLELENKKFELTKKLAEQDEDEHNRITIINDIG